MNLKFNTKMSIKLRYTVDEQIVMIREEYARKVIKLVYNFDDFPLRLDMHEAAIRYLKTHYGRFIVKNGDSYMIYSRSHKQMYEMCHIIEQYYNKCSIENDDLELPIDKLSNRTINALIQKFAPNATIKNKRLIIRSKKSLKADLKNLKKQMMRRMKNKRIDKNIRKNKRIQKNRRRRIHRN